MKETIARLISMQIQRLLNQRKENGNNLSNADNHEETAIRDNLTRELTVWQIVLLIIEKLIR